MSVVKLIDDYLLEFGNERFMDGWDANQRRVIRILEIQIDKINRLTAGVDSVEKRMQGIAIEVALAKTIALIKGENK